MPKVYSPYKQYTGTHAFGVRFVDGVGETDDPRALDWFRRHGYRVEEKKAAAKSSGSSKRRSEAKGDAGDGGGAVPDQKQSDE